MLQFVDLQLSGNQLTEMGLDMFNNMTQVCRHLLCFVVDFVDHGHQASHVFKHASAFQFNMCGFLQLRNIDLSNTSIIGTLPESWNESSQASLLLMCT